MQKGSISPEQAIEQFEYPARHISEIPIDNLRIDILDCGFNTLNEALVFKQNRGELIILGARPSMGKSALAFQIAAYVARKHNVLIYSLEMDRESIKARMLAAESKLGLRKIQRGEVLTEQLQKANRSLNALNYYIDDRSALDISTLKASAITHHKKHPLSLVVVDYLGLIRSRDRASRTEEVGDVTGELKALAKELRCPVLVAAQLNRNCDQRASGGGSRKPTLSDLRDSGNIEQDADVVLFLSRQQVYDNTRPDEADISIGKNRNGETKDFVYKFLGASTRFIDQEDEI